MAQRAINPVAIRQNTSPQPERQVLQTVSQTNLQPQGPGYPAIHVDRYGRRGPRGYPGRPIDRFAVQVPVGDRWRIRRGRKEEEEGEVQG